MWRARLNFDWILLVESIHSFFWIHRLINLPQICSIGIYFCHIVCFNNSPHFLSRLLLRSYFYKPKKFGLLFLGLLHTFFHDFELLKLYHDFWTFRCGFSCKRGPWYAETVVRPDVKVKKSVSAVYETWMQQLSFSANLLCFFSC